MFVPFIIFSSLLSAQEGETWWQSPSNLNVRDQPALTSEIRGQILAHQSFTVFALAAGSDCAGSGWAIVEAGGYACLEHAQQSSTAPASQPALLAFSAPTPSDYAGYVKSGKYTRGVRTPLLPYIYGKRWRQWKGNVWSTPESWANNEPPVDQLDLHHNYRFVGEVETPKGRVFLRPNGSAVPETELYLFPITDFHGQNLTQQPLPIGTMAAWVNQSGGARPRDAPSAAGELGARLAYQQALVVRSVAGKGVAWLEIADATGAGTGQFIEATALRVWTPTARPVEVVDGERWIDVDLKQQVLAILLGDKPEFITLISSGVAGHETPKGSFRIYDAFATAEMSSLAGADEPYEVEAVPWALHFKPRYLLHGSFWHWRFGTAVSHGCVNLSPADARFVFGQVVPTLPPGFGRVNVTIPEQGTLVRIR